MHKKIKLLLLVTMFVLFSLFFSQIASAIEIEIQPVLKGEEYYIMKFGQTQTFQALGFGWDKNTEQKIPNREIKTIQWNFDSRFLELVKKESNIITLKAIKARTSKLTVTGMVDNKTVTKTIFIVVERR